MLAQQEHCNTCGKETWHEDGICVDCRENRKKATESVNSRIWASLTDSQKIEILYRRVVDLERSQGAALGKPWHMG